MLHRKGQLTCQVLGDAIPSVWSVQGQVCHAVSTLVQYTAPWTRWQIASHAWPPAPKPAELFTLGVDGGGEKREENHSHWHAQSGADTFTHAFLEEEEEEEEEGKALPQDTMALDSKEREREWMETVAHNPTGCTHDKAGGARSSDFRQGICVASRCRWLQTPFLPQSGDP